jgi:hypothetical protein
MIIKQHARRAGDRGDDDGEPAGTRANPSL